MTRGEKWAPVGAEGEDLAGFTPRLPAHVALARLWNRYAPRGKGFVPRLLGRTFGRNAKAFLVTTHGARLAIEPGSLDVYAVMLNRGGAWDAPVFEVCSSMTSPGSVFYDVGANVGYMAIEMAALHGDSVRVVAFEPQPALALAIARSARLNGLANVAVFDVMLGDEEGEGELFLASHSLHASMIPYSARARRVARRMATVDGMVAAGVVPPPDVMKLDVEGAELKVLLGARQTVAANRPAIVLEANENMGRFGYGVRDLLELLRGAGRYDFFVLRHGALDVVPIGAWREAEGPADIVAVPPARGRPRAGTVLQAPSRSC